MGCWSGTEGDSAVRQSAARCVKGQVQMRRSRRPGCQVRRRDPALDQAVCLANVKPSIMTWVMAPHETQNLSGRQVGSTTSRCVLG